MVDIREVMQGRAPAPASQDLTKTNRIETYGRPPGFWKSIILDILSIGSAAGFSFLYYRYLTAGLPIGYLLGSLAVFGVLSVLQAFLSTSFFRRAIVIFLEAASFIAFFYADDWRILLIAGGVVFFFLLLGYASCRSYIKESIEVPFLHATGSILGKVTTAALIFMILAYVPQLGGDKVFVSRQSFRMFFDWSSSTINNFYPNVSLDGTFGNFADSIVKMEFDNNPSFQSLSPHEKTIAEAQASQQFAGNFALSSSTPIDASAPTSDAFYDFIVGILNAWKMKSSIWFAVGWAVVLFLTLRTIGIVFVWVMQFLSLIFYEILLGTGFMKITEEIQTKEVIGY